MQLRQRIPPYEFHPTMTNQTPELNCVHGRPGGQLCPHCLLSPPPVPGLIAFMSAVAEERQRQTILHPGTEDLPDGDGFFNPHGRRTYEDIARLSEKRAAKEGRLTFSHVFEEEAAEVLTAAAEGATLKLRTELVQVAAVCLKWLQALDRREAKWIDTMAKREDEEGMPNISLPSRKKTCNSCGDSGGILCTECKQRICVNCIDDHYKTHPEAREKMRP